MSEKEDLKKALDLVEKHLNNRSGKDPSQQHYNKEGMPITLGEWMVLFEDQDYRSIIVTDTQEGCTISTVWLGLPHGRGPNGPVIFETAIFNHEDDELEIYRYATEDEARRNHEYLVELHGGLARKSQNVIRHRNRMRAIAEETND